MSFPAQGLSLSWAVSPLEGGVLYCWAPCSLDPDGLGPPSTNYSLTLKKKNHRDGGF